MLKVDGTERLEAAPHRGAHAGTERRHLL